MTSQECQGAQINPSVGSGILDLSTAIKMADNSLETESCSIDLVETANSVTHHSSADMKPDISTNNIEMDTRDGIENNHCDMKNNDFGSGDASCKLDSLAAKSEESLDDSAIVRTDEDMSATPSEPRDDCADVDLKSEDADGLQTIDDIEDDEEDALKFSGLKKDDSGIDVERSPIKDTSFDDKSAHANNEDSSGSKVKTLPSTSNDSEGLDTNVDTDIDDFATSGNMKVRKPLVDYTDDEDDDEDDDKEEAAEKGKKDSDDEEEEYLASDRKRRLARIHTSSSSSSSTTEGADEHDDTTDEKSDKSDEGDEMDVEAERPKDYWRTLFELRQRENGCNNRMYMPEMFGRHTGSSLMLVQRLALQYKMKNHDGCVNALHFNKSGS